MKVCNYQNDHQLPYFSQASTFIEAAKKCTNKISFIYYTPFNFADEIQIKSKKE